MIIDKYTKTAMLRWEENKMNPKAIRHIIGWSGLIVTVGFVAGFMSFFFNLSGYDINIRWIVIPCVALTLFLFPKIKEWIKKGAL